jgi:tetratricopeptide (TPR) repeat protein
MIPPIQKRRNTILNHLQRRTLADLREIVYRVLGPFAYEELRGETLTEKAVAFLERAAQSEDESAFLTAIESQLDIGQGEGQLFFNSARESYRQENYTEAAKDFGIALGMGQNSGAYLLRGMSYFQQRNYEAALADLNRAIEIDPTDAYTYIQRARVLSVMDRYRDAFKDFQSAIDLEPERDLYHRWFGHARYAKGYYPSALESFNEAVKLQNAPADHNYRWRGLAYLQLEENAKAHRDLKEAYSLSPDTGDNAFWYAISCSLMAYIEEATSAWHKAEQVAARETDPILSQRKVARQEAVAGHANIACAYYEDMLSESQEAFTYQMELCHLELLAKLFPARPDLADLAAWFKGALSPRK